MVVFWGLAPRPSGLGSLEVISMFKFFYMLKPLRASPMQGANTAVVFLRSRATLYSFSGKYKRISLDQIN